MHWQQRHTSYADRHFLLDVSAQPSAPHHDPTAHHINTANYQRHYNCSISNAHPQQKYSYTSALVNVVSQ